MSTRTFDVIVIGSGSVGMPTALFLSQAGLRTAVFEGYPSPGQGANKAAIGGVRATHSDAAKIILGSESLHFFRTWQETYGTSLGWKKGGYLFPVYREEDEKTLRDLLPFQRSYNLDIRWIEPKGVADLVPGIREEGLLGGTWSPDDGQVSPLLANDAMFRTAEKAGCSFFFNEAVREIISRNGKVEGVQSKSGRTIAGAVIVAAGAKARQVLSPLALEVPVFPEIHEAGITSPMADFLSPLVVDMRPGRDGKTANFYFGQNAEGAVLFCYTPRHPHQGLTREGTSEFLPIFARRLLDLLPRMKNALVRRTWAGHYPMTPDGLPVLGRAPGFSGLFLAVGMCGQGFMLGPGVGKTLLHLVTERITPEDEKVLRALNPSRRFSKEHAEVLA
ncbi:MAG: FAD-binding oxidoreductase [Spirochaetales bacterium]|nr:FAD-binding oxidoreductase [Spirochaetales bacterium]